MDDKHEIIRSPEEVGQIIGQIVIKVSENKSDLRISGMENIHPIYEALIALLRRHVPDTKIAQRFVKDENSLREFFATDTLLDILKKPEQTRNLEEAFSSGKTLKEIAEMAALYISEGKLAKEGKVLHTVTEKSYRDPLFMKALKKAKPESVYVEGKEIERISQESSKMRKRRKYGRIITGILIAGLASTGYYGSKKYQVKISENPVYPAQLEKNVSCLEQQLKDKQAELKKKAQEFSELERKVSEKSSEMRTLETKVSGYNQEMQLLNDRLPKAKASIENAKSSLAKAESELKEKEDKFNSVKTESSKLAEDYKNLGKEYVVAGKNNEARRILEKALELNQNDSHTNNLLGIAYLNEKNLSEAKKFLDKAIELNPNDASYHHNLAVYYAWSGDKETAIKLYQKAIGIAPAFAPPYYNLGQIKCQDNEKEKAISCFKKFLELDTSDNERTKDAKTKISEIEKKLAQEKEHEIEVE
ncbi:MAG: tetratricopeptide repeat protein [Nanoarchaeota archaeon]|nr:tetratricopeptide repeat protein [Nanoarchaeota archaeon]MBU4086591.1 tetratricopeptide repeat protein [Nanoarchaeota archaeon]